MFVYMSVVVCLLLFFVGGFGVCFLLLFFVVVVCLFCLGFFGFFCLFVFVCFFLGGGVLLCVFSQYFVYLASRVLRIVLFSNYLQCCTQNRPPILRPGLAPIFEPLTSSRHPFRSVSPCRHSVMYYLT